jgi:hypothetical protein
VRRVSREKFRARKKFRTNGKNEEFSLINLLEILTV